MLVGNLDGSVLRYLMVVADLVARVPWTNPIQARAFFSLMYEFLGDEELDALQLAYVSFAENRISPSHLFDFVLYLILKGREPRFQEVPFSQNSFLCLENSFFPKIPQTPIILNNVDKSL